MPKSAKPRPLYSLYPWRTEHHDDRSEIAAYVEASGKWETVAVIPHTPGASAETLAEFIMGIINDSQKNRDLLRDATRALEAVMEEGLTFSTEQDADAILKRVKGASA